MKNSTVEIYANEFQTRVLKERLISFYVRCEGGL